MRHVFWFQHKYLPISVKHGTADVHSTLTNEKLSEKVPCTLVLYKCKCGHIMTKTIKGDWTLDEVKERLLDKIKERL